MTVLTAYLQNSQLGHLFRTAAFTKPSALFVGLISSVTAIKTGAVTELSGGGYGRVALPPSDSNWADPESNNGITSNLVEIRYQAATANWLPASHWGIWDAQTAGHPMLVAPFDSPRIILKDVTAVFGVGTLQVQLDV